MKKRIVQYIENEPWDERLIRLEKQLDWWVALPILAVASLYFGVVCLLALTR